MWALRPHQQAQTQLPSQPTSNRVLVRSSTAMSWRWVPVCFFHDLNGTAHTEEAQLSFQHLNGNRGVATGSRMQQSIALGELSSYALRASASPHPTLYSPLYPQGDNLALTHLWSTCMPIAWHKQQHCSPTVRSQLLKQH